MDCVATSGKQASAKNRGQLMERESGRQSEARRRQGGRRQQEEE
jgi:hypothetical protein